MPHPLSYRYVFTPETGGREVFEVVLDPASLELRAAAAGGPPPAWTALGYERCGNCTLDPERHPQCPLATAVADPVERFHAMKSHDRLYLEVQSETRIVSQYTTAQEAVSSLMGLLGAASGCPHTAWLRPLARFHLPLASEQETIFRAGATWLLERQFTGATAAAGLDELRGRYRDLQRMNRGFAHRLRSLDLDGDSCVNALIRLDNLGRPAVLDRCLQDLQRMFESLAAVRAAMDQP